MRKPYLKGPNKQVAERFLITPRNHLDQVIFTYKTIDNESKRLFEGYLTRHKALLDLPYVAISKDMFHKVNVEAGRKGVSIQQAIPQQHLQDIHQLQSEILSFESAYSQYNEEGWLYTFNDSTTSYLYVGKTGHKYAIGRAGAHVKSSGKTKLEIYLQQHPGWKLQIILPRSCEQLIRKSFLLPCQFNETVMHNLEEAYQAKRRSDSVWWLERAEWVLIAVFQPKFNVTHSMN